MQLGSIIVETGLAIKFALLINHKISCKIWINHKINPVAKLIAIVYINNNLHYSNFCSMSVHLQNFPDVSLLPSEDILTNQMDKIRDICNIALSLRNKLNIRIRQPLAGIKIYGGLNDDLATLAGFEDILKEELNVKKIEIFADFSEVAEITLQVNLPIVGKRLGKAIKEIMPLVKQGKWQQDKGSGNANSNKGSDASRKDAKDADKGGNILIGKHILQPHEYKILLKPRSDYQKNSAPSSDNSSLIIIDTNITTELQQEGIARDLTRAIQNLRKEADLHISDNINLYLSCQDDFTRKSIDANKIYIKQQTLATGLSFVESTKTLESMNLSHQSCEKLDNQDITIALQKL